MGSWVDQSQQEEVWASFFAYGSYGLPHQTFWEGIDQLPGGHYLKFQKGELNVQKWYHFEERVKALQKEQVEDEEDTILSLLNDAIKLRLEQMFQ